MMTVVNTQLAVIGGDPGGRRDYSQFRDENYCQFLKPVGSVYNVAHVTKSCGRKITKFNCI